jgi:hypothetical protein
MHLGRQGKRLRERDRERERERERCCNIYIGKRLAAWDPILYTDTVL